MTNSTVRRNPYIIGRPINEPELIFGRESLFHFIEDNLQHNEKVILLHGQRRMGKSSVLHNIANFVAPEEFAFVPFDLQDHIRQPLHSILYALATEIIDRLDLDSSQITLPSATDLGKDRYIFARQFLPQVYQILSGKKLVFLLDEFDALSNEDSESLVADFFPYLYSIATIEDHLFIILFAGRKSEDLPTLLNIFKEAPFQEIGLLDEPSAKLLITKPAQGILEYDSDAIRGILELSAGHPYFTQTICFALFGRARELQNWKITREDVVNVAEKAIELAEAGLIWFWEGLSIPEQVVFSAVAEAAKIAAVETNKQVPEDPLTLLKSYGVIQTNSLIEAAKQLVKKGFLDNTGRRVKVELIRRWLVQRHPVRHEISQLEKLEQEEVNSLWEVAAKLRQQGKKQNALTLYEQILNIHPNHFSTIVALAEGYLEMEDFDKAVGLYTRAYQVDPIRNEEGLVRALQSSGKKLITQQEFRRANEQFNRVLEIEPDNRSAREKLLTIEARMKSKKASGTTEFLVDNDHRNNYTSQYNSIPYPGILQAVNIQEKRNPLLIPITALIGAIGFISLIAVGFDQRSKTCSGGQHKVLDIGCVGQPNLDMSRGEQTLFPHIKNVARDQGIEAFKQGNYSEAIEFFKRSVLSNRNDPESLIYYNNARAQQQNSPLTLATVVPVDNEETTAQEILRGVAQAQDHFNKKGGFNGRLLEIAIANDDNQPDQARQVAQQLVQDQSILGVIGHNSSNATKSALGEYEKAGLPIISPTSVTDSLTHNVFFTTVPSDTTTGKILAEYALKKLGLNKVLVFYNPDSVYSDSLTKEFTKNFEQLKGKVVGKIDLTETRLDTEKEVLNNLFKYQAQAVVLFPDTQQSSVALKIATVNANLIASRDTKKRELKLLGGDTLYSNTTLQQGRKAVEGLIVAVPWFRETPQSKNFAQAAAKQWGRAINWRTATSFDATQAFITALSSSSNPSRETVLQKLQNVKLSSTETSGDILQFTADGERQSKPILVRVERGKFVLVK